MLYSPKIYYYEALSRYDAIEESTKFTVNTQDAGITATEWAIFISRARYDVIVEALKQQRQIVNTNRETITLTGGGNYKLAPPGSILRHTPLAITLVEAQRNGQFFPMDYVPDNERWRFESAAYIGTSAFPGVWNYQGSTLRLFPDPGESFDLRVTYVPMPGWYTEEEFDKETLDDIVPAPLQPMVATQACWHAQQKDTQNINNLLGLQSIQSAVLATLHNAAGAEHIVYTGANE